jgi:hypothetical protein
MAHHIPEDGILHSPCRENLKSYKNKLVMKCYNELRIGQIVWIHDLRLGKWTLDLVHGM